MALYPLKELNSLPIFILRFNSRFNSWIFRDWGCQYVNYLNVKLAIYYGLCKLLDEYLLNQRVYFKHIIIGEDSHYRIIGILL